MLQSLGPGFGRVEKEAMLAESRLIARDLTPPGSNPAEVLMADRAALSWLQVRLLDLDRADLLQQEKPDPRRLDLIDRLLSRAQARMERALLAIARLKRLKLPAVFATQINVNQHAGRRSAEADDASPFDPAQFRELFSSKGPEPSMSRATIPPPAGPPAAPASPCRCRRRHRRAPPPRRPFPEIRPRRAARPRHSGENNPCHLPSRACLNGRIGGW